MEKKKKNSPRKMSVDSRIYAHTTAQILDLGMDHLTSFAASAVGVPAEAGLAVVLAFGLGFVVHACLRFGRAFLFGGGSSNGSGARAASSATVAGPASLRFLPLFYFCFHGLHVSERV